MNYYNEHDKYAAEWLRNLMDAGEIPKGIVDERSITDVSPTDLVGFAQCHFFAGIGGWSLALRLARWPDDRPVWTGSCPCQPFSKAGKRKGHTDDRHLWPDWFRLIRECRPSVTIGEQVEDAVRHGWLDGVFGDLEAEGYACGAIVLGAHSVGAPHVRQRLFWVADNCGRGSQVAVQHAGDCATADSRWQATWIGRRRLPVELEHASCNEREPRRTESDWRSLAGGCGSDDLGDALKSGLEGHAGDQSGRHGAESNGSTAEAGAWDQCNLVYCRDGKTRRVPVPESGVQPLAYGIPRDMGRRFPEVGGMARGARSNRVGRLKGYGNAIVPQVAAEFIKAYIQANQ